MGGLEPMMVEGLPATGGRDGCEDISGLSRVCFASSQGISSLRFSYIIMRCRVCQHVKSSCALNFSLFDVACSKRKFRWCLVWRKHFVTGVGRIENDMLCEQWEDLSKDLEICVVVFRVPERNARIRWGDYVMVTETGPQPFKLAE